MAKIPFPKAISKEEINEFPQIQFEGTIHLIETPQKIDFALQRLQAEPYLGFDTETRPAFRKGQQNSVSLLQLATANEAFLFRLNTLHFPKKLQKILSAKRQLKLGVAVHDDLRALQRLAPFESQGFVDFAQIAKKLGFKNLGLRSLAGIFLKGRISKGARLSNWDSKELTPTQLNYAATDAWVCREIYVRLLQADLPAEVLQDLAQPSSKI